MSMGGGGGRALCPGVIAPGHKKKVVRQSEVFWRAVEHVCLTTLVFWSTSLVWPGGLGQAQDCLVLVVGLLLCVYLLQSLECERPGLLSGG